MFSGKETGQQPGGLSPPRENHAVVTPESKERNPTRLTSLVEQLYHLQFFFTTKPNSKNGTGLVGFDILKWTSQAVTCLFLEREV